MTRVLTATAILALMSAGPAAAQMQKDSQQSPSQAQTQQQSQQKQDLQFVTAQGSRDWSAQALIGREVQNGQREELGEINNVIIDEQGRVKAVTIGVGGFLGIGEKDVGVPFSALEFREDQQARVATTPGNRTLNPGQTRQPSAGSGMATGQQQAETQGSATNQAQRQTTGAAPAGDRYDNEHRNVIIVLNATKEQLESAPGFKWLEEQGQSGQPASGTARQPMQNESRQ